VALVSSIEYNVSMSEGTNIIEKEIADLSVAIQEKRAQLERERGSAVEASEALHHVVSEKLAMAPTPAPQANHLASQKTKSYLDDLDPIDTEKINSYIDLIPKQGLEKTINQVKNESAYLLDAFHDALVDKLKEELKKQNLI